MSPVEADTAPTGLSPKAQREKKSSSESWSIHHGSKDAGKTSPLWQHQIPLSLVLLDQLKGTDGGN